MELFSWEAARRPIRGRLAAANLGVHIGGGAGALTNSGAISGTTQGGVAFIGGGTVNNQSGGSISGANFGVYIGGGSAATNSVTNTGGIYRRGDEQFGRQSRLRRRGDQPDRRNDQRRCGRRLHQGGTGWVINGGDIHGTAASGNGAVLLGGGTVTNTGTITGGNLGVYIGGRRRGRRLGDTETRARRRHGRNESSGSISGATSASTSAVGARRRTR